MTGHRENSEPLMDELLSSELLYPSPAVQEVTIPRAARGERIGVRFQKAAHKQVVVHHIYPDSPLRSTHLREGCCIISVNGNVVSTVEECTDLVKHCTIGTLTFLFCNHILPTSYCRIAAAVPSRSIPSIVVESIRNNSLLRVARISSQSPFLGKGVREGDILLAIDETPVTQLETANRLILAASMATTMKNDQLPPKLRKKRKYKKGNPFLMSLYFLDTEQLQADTVERVLELEQSHQLFGDICVRRLDSSSSNVGQKDFVVEDGASQQVLGKIRSDPETLEFIPRPDAGTSGFFDNNGYDHETMAPFLKLYNKLWNDRMRFFEEAAGSSAFQHSVFLEESDVMMLPRSKSSKKPPVFRMNL